MYAQLLFDMRGQPAVPPRRLVFGHRDRMDEQEDTIRTMRDERFRYIRYYHPDRPLCNTSSTSSASYGSLMQGGPSSISQARNR